jgi:xanthine phosphoribosyltransferase
LDQAQAKLSGIGIVIEKAFQGGGKELREKGIKLESLAVIKSIEDNNIVFY